jgi:hypothetical protein
VGYSSAVTHGPFGINALNPTIRRRLDRSASRIVDTRAHLWRKSGIFNDDMSYLSMGLAPYVK